MANWSADIMTDPNRGHRLHVELSEDGNQRARLYEDENGHLQIQFYGGAPAVVPADWLIGIVERFKDDLRNSNTQKRQVSSQDNLAGPFTGVIEEWFAKELGGSLILPDGWFGRPFDSQLSLTSIDESSKGLFLILEKKLKLRFEGLKSIERRGRDLVFGPFDLLHFEWESFGSDGACGSKDYQSGEVSIMAAPG